MIIDRDTLMNTAREARQHAYAPYSGFAVGASLLAEDGRIFGGCNVENASYSLTCCAERGAVMQAVASGATRFCAVAIVGGPIGDDGNTPCYPCGACLQVLSEFCDPETPVCLAGGDVTLRDLMPKAFNLGR